MTTTPGSRKKAKAEPAESTAVAVIEEEQVKTLVLEGDPEQQLEFARKAAKALMSVVGQKPKKVVINGKQFLEFGDWQTLARFFGATVATDWTKPIMRDGKVIGYEAKSVVMHKGEIISSAEGMCTIDEAKWSNRDEYAVRSMAQTRTGAKALRNAFGWVAELAGYSGTPAEEMDGIVGRTDEPFPSTNKRPAPAPVDPVTERKTRVVVMMKRLGHDLMAMDKALAAATIKDVTGLAMNDENLIEIVNRLSVLVAEHEEAQGGNVEKTIE